MAKQTLSINVTDRADGMPAQLLPNGNWGQWSLELDKYVDTGLQAYPEDDANVIKYYKLTNSSTTPTPPKPIKSSDGWKTLSDLNDALHKDGWSDDPLNVSDKQRYQWVAIYLKRNVPVPDKDKGTIQFVPRYTYRIVGLYTNYAASPTVTFDEARRTITFVAADGQKVVVKVPTTEAVDALTTLVSALKRQVDKAVYSYEGEGTPTMDGPIVSDWLEGEGGEMVTDDKVKADIFATHVGDAYFDKTSNLAYRFGLKIGGDPSNPKHYSWEVVKDSALSAAIARISEMEGGVVKVWTETPAKGDKYKPGDLLLYKVDGEWRYKTCIAATTPPEYEYKETDWVEPYATAKEVASIRDTLVGLAGDLTKTKQNIKDLQEVTDDIKGEWIRAITDKIIDEQERKRLTDLSTRIDEEQSQLQSNVDYIVGSPYYVNGSTEADNLRAAADALLKKKTGAIDKLQAAISTAIKDSLISTDEIVAVDAAISAYKHARETLLAAITAARAQIDKELPKSFEGRNLLKPVGTLGSTSNKNLTVEVVSPYEIVWTQKNSSTAPYTLYFHVDSLPAGVYTLSYKTDKEVSARNYIYSTQGALGRLISSSCSSISSRVEDYYQHSFVLKFEHGITTDNLYFYGVDPQDPITSVRIWDVKLERGPVATPWSDAPEDRDQRIKAEMAANPPRISSKGTWEVYTYDNGKFAYVDTGRPAVGDDGKAPKVVDGYWHEWDGSKYTNTGVKAQGEDGRPGEDALSTVLLRQGSYKTSYRMIGDDGQLLDTPQVIKTVEGGEDGKVVVRALIRKGVRDVTASAISKGANPVWYLNGTRIASGSAVLRLGVGDHVDGKTDAVTFDYDDSRASEW